MTYGAKHLKELRHTLASSNHEHRPPSTVVRYCFSTTGAAFFGAFLVAVFFLELAAAFFTLGAAVFGALAGLAAFTVVLAFLGATFFAVVFLGLAIAVADFFTGACCDDREKGSDSENEWVEMKGSFMDLTFFVAVCIASGGQTNHPMR